MASGNRVEELEARVKQLEASVTGLTDELVECKERLRALEDAVDPDVDDIIEGRTTRSGDDESESEASKSSQENDETSTDSDSDEIIVA